MQERKTPVPLVTAEQVIAVLGRKMANKFKSVHKAFMKVGRVRSLFEVAGCQCDHASACRATCYLVMDASSTLLASTPCTQGIFVLPWNRTLACAWTVASVIGLVTGRGVVSMLGVVHLRDLVLWCCATVRITCHAAISQVHERQRVDSVHGTPVQIDSQRPHFVQVLYACGGRAHFTLQRLEGDRRNAKQTHDSPRWMGSRNHHSWFDQRHRAGSSTCVSQDRG